MLSERVRWVNTRDVCSETIWLWSPYKGPRLAVILIMFVAVNTMVKSWLEQVLEKQQKKVVPDYVYIYTYIDLYY